MKELVKESLIEDIISSEWQFFTTTINRNHRAPCQDQKGNFLASRRSYWTMYSLDVLNSYVNDIAQAIMDHQNLVTLKYAYMMQFTHPDEYKNIASRLPAISPNKQALVKEIIKIYMNWEHEIAEHHPELDNHNRPLHQDTNQQKYASVEIYMTGELLSYSEETVLKIYAYFLSLISSNTNPIKIYLEELNSY